MWLVLLGIISLAIIILSKSNLVFPFVSTFYYSFLHVTIGIILIFDFWIFHLIFTYLLLWIFFSIYLIYTKKSLLG